MDLAAIIRSEAQIYETRAKKWFKDTAQAVNYIHNIGLAHLDLKLTNFLIDSNDNVLLADFCVAIF